MYYPLRSLREGHWFKLICGASYQHLPAVRSLVLAYTLAGADCIDVAADPAVVSAARDALQVASGLTQAAQARGFNRGFHPSQRGTGSEQTWLMVSLNDGEDPHFRKATFEPSVCPIDCSRPCEQVCPAEAIVFSSPYVASTNDAGSGISGVSGVGVSGVIDSRCYGCGRCLPVCPIQQISTRSYVSTPAVIAPLVLTGVDAVEIHTQVGRWQDFKRLWQSIAPFVPHLKLIAISCPDSSDGKDLIDYLWTLYDLIAPLPCALIWQTDGRPMSGDLGKGATRAAVKLGQKVLEAGLPGYVQLAGGTNNHTVSKLQAAGLLKGQPHRQNPVPDRYIAGVAYGSYARTLLSPVLEQLEARRVGEQESGRVGKLTFSSPHLSLPPFPHSPPLESVPDLLWQAVHLADSLVSQLKAPMNLKQTIPR